MTTTTTLTPAQIKRLSEVRQTYQARYPAADASLTLGERIAADEKTMRRALEERSRRQYVTS